MKITIELSGTLPEGHGASFKKGIAEALLAHATTPIYYTPNGHDRSREQGKQAGKILSTEIAKIVKPVKTDK